MSPESRSVPAPAPVIVGGAPEGFDALILAREVAAGGRPLVHVARDDRRMEAMRAALAFFAPDLPVVTFPAWDCLPFDRVSPNPEIAAARLATLAALAHGGLPGRFVLLTTLNAASQRIPARATVRAASLVATVGRPLDAAHLRAFLARMGYAQTATVSTPGDFAVRGGIIDVWPPGAEGPVRLDLFGDVLEAARRFDPLSQRTVERLGRLELAPASEVILDTEAIARFRQAYRVEFGAAVADDPVYAAVTQGRKHAGMEHWLPYFHDRLETLFDHLPGAAVALDDQTEAARVARWEGIAEQHAARQAALADRRAGDNPYRPCPPGLLYLDEAAWRAALEGRRVLQLSVLPRGQGPGVIDAGGRLGRNFAPERQDEKISLFDAFAAHVQTRRELSQVIVASYSDGARERLKGLLEDHGIAGDILIRNVSDIAQGTGSIHLATWALEHGFEAPGLTVISEQDVLGDRLIRAPKRRRKAENFLREAESLAPGDLVVHVEHGIGRFRGLETITAMGAPHECIALEYAGGDRLFLPVENIELLTRYGAEEGTPDRLGGGAWQARKARLKERIREIADRLIRIAAERQLRAAPVFAAAGEPWEAFCARFPYVETDDQLAAIADVVADLDRATPMDRLIVGDVGFGKTEVAMRAAFVVAMAGAQVAVVCPTTLLARQHFRSFADRFRGSPLVVRQLSRFVPARAAAETRAGLADGRVDIVVGTHALLARGVAFGNLGLLVVDEEQHFGVAHKERLKELRSDVHVLTLTATPIPRTLQLALTGVRDLSVIATPPVDRLAVRTYVSEFDPVTVREALLREHYRGGQSFFVVPRIADLPEIEEFLAAQVPEVKVVTAHGQMPAALLDERMNAFYDGRYDVLLSTSIIESGLDIPTANTMIVHRADMFGLAQLYQMRGRVGRAKLRAYCFLTTKPRTPLTPAAEKRLRLLGSLDSLGAGFNLAAHDLDLRGAGNILGEEQSGHIREVGHELYQQLLEEAVARLKAGEGAAMPEPADGWSPQINLGVPVLIPEAYVPDLDVRLGLYRRLAGLEGKVEVEGFAAELIDRFGPLPREVNTLLLVVRIKAMCRKAGIARLDGGPRGATIQFHGDRFANPAGLVEFLTAEDGAARIRDNRLVIRRDWTAEAERIRGAFALARDLAQKAGAAPGAAAARPG
jgi:transcription-repair coupling factor (superfamily II helicase)